MVKPPANMNKRSSLTEPEAEAPPRDRYMGQTPQFGSEWRTKTQREWAAQLEVHILNRKYEIMRPGATRGNMGQVKLIAEGIPARECNLNDYDHLFGRDNHVLRSFAGIHRLGDDFTAIDATMSGWSSFYTGATSAVAGGVASGLVMASSLWSAFLKDKAQYNAVQDSNRAAIVERQQAIAQLKTQMAEVAASAQPYAQAVLEFLQAAPAKIAQYTAEIATAQKTLEASAAGIQSLDQSAGLAHAVMSVLPEGLHAGVALAADKVAYVTSGFTSLAGTTLLAGAAALVVSSGAYWYFNGKARRAYHKVQLDRARDEIRVIAKTIAAAEMKLVLEDRSLVSTLHREALEVEQKRMQARQFEQSGEMLQLFREQMASQRQIRRTADETLLHTLVSQIQNYGVDPFQLLVYVARKIKNGEVDAEAGRSVLTNFAYAGDGLSAPGPLMAFLLRHKTELEQRVQQSGSAIALATQQQRVQDQEQLQTVYSMLEIVNRLRAADWTLDAISQVDWDLWARRVLSDGQVTWRLDREVLDFQKNRGHDLRLPGTNLALTREQKEQLQNKIQDTIFTGADMEDPARRKRGCIVISYERNSFEADDGQDMWREKDTPLNQRPPFKLNGAQTSNYERASSILMAMITSTRWSAKQENLQPIFNSYQTLWLYRWMGPACSRWLTPDEEYARASERSTEVLARPSDPKRPRLAGDQPVLERQLPLSQGVKTVSFVSDMCRMRFAFLKAMLAHSLLFLFVRPSEAFDMLRNKKPQDRHFSCVARALQSLRSQNAELGLGFGLLLLDNCRPGHALIAGLAEDGTEVQHPVDVTEWVDLTVDLVNPQQWSFNHHRILYNIVNHAFRLGLRLVSNVCWKNTHQFYQETLEQHSLLKYLQAFPQADARHQVGAFQSARYLYGLARSASLGAYLTSKSEELVKLAKTAKVRFFHGAVDQFETRVGTIQKLWQDHSRLMGRETSDEEKKWNAASLKDSRSPAADTAFLETAQNKDILTDNECKDLRQHIETVINNNDYWQELFEAKGYSQCDVQPIIVLNNLCVNPFALCIYDKPRPLGRGIEMVERRKTVMHRVFGDLWFLQPLLIQFAKKSNLGYAIKRFDKAQEWFRDDTRRLYLQDALYLDGWASLLAADAQ